MGKFNIRNFKSQVIAIDGKALRGAKSKGKKSPVHMVSAWVRCEKSYCFQKVSPHFWHYSYKHKIVSKLAVFNVKAVEKILIIAKLFI